MALVAASQFATWDPTAGTMRLDVSEVLHAILPYEVNTLKLFRVGTPGIAVKHEWIQAELNPPTVKSAASGTGSALTASDADVDLLFLAGDYAKLREGVILEPMVAGKTEQIQVVTLAGDAVATVVRQVNGVAAEAHAASTEWRIVHMARQEGMAPDTDRTKVRTVPFNYHGILERAVQFTGTAMQLKPYAMASDFTTQLEYRMMELKRELGTMAIYSPRIGPRSDTVYSSPGGLAWFCKQTGGIYSAVANTNFGGSTINTMVKAIFDKGAEPSHLILPSVLIAKLIAEEQPKLRVSREDSTAGKYITHYLTNQGIELEIIPERFMNEDDAAVVDGSRLEIIPLGNRQLSAEPKPKVADAQVVDIIGEYTFAIHNALEAHAFYRYQS